jgi:hypothetical protein
MKYWLDNPSAADAIAKRAYCIAVADFRIDAINGDSYAQKELSRMRYGSHFERILCDFYGERVTKAARQLGFHAVHVSPEFYNLPAAERLRDYHHFTILPRNERELEEPLTDPSTHVLDLTFGQFIKGTSNEGATGDKPYFYGTVGDAHKLLQVSKDVSTTNIFKPPTTHRKGQGECEGEIVYS